MKITIIVLGAITAGSLLGQVPTITSVGGAGTNLLCPGGRAFVQGTNLGGNAATVTVGTQRAYVRNSGAAFLDVQIPVDAPLGATTLKVGSSAPFNITLVKYAPGVLTDGLPDDLAAASHYPSQVPVTAAYPAAPNEQIALFVNGLGPTNPVVPTGIAPADSSAVTTTLPSITIAGESAKVSSAFLSPNDIGIYTVVLTVPADIKTGTQKISVGIGGVTSGAANFPVVSGPIISSVTSAASYIDPSLPNGPIAQGSVFVIFGNNLGPGAISIDPNPFHNTTLSGSSVSVTINGTTVAALMYYTSVGQTAALLPSNTPVGTGTITATYNGQAGPAHPITVVANNVGIFTVTSDGQGAGIVTYPDYSLVSTAKAGNCGGVYTTCGAANPGDVLTIWATGLGPITGSDASGDGLGVNMSSIPLTIWLGGVPIQAIYQGRSGCCIGEDQIAFTVPANVATGCAVPLSIQINSFISNSVALPVAPAGVRTCTPANSGFTAANVVELSSGSGPFTYGEIDLKRKDNYPGFQDVVNGQFMRFTVAPAKQPFFFSYVDDPPMGTCQVFNNFNSPNPPFATLAGLDAGPQITVEAPNGSKSASGSGGNYKATLSASGTFLSAGNINVSAPGGADVPGFSTSITLPALPVMTSPTPDSVNPLSVTRSNGLTVSWSGGSANEYVELDGYNNTDNTGATGAVFQCTVPASAGTFVVPPSVLLALPPGSFGGLIFHPAVMPVNFAGSGLTASRLTLWFSYFAPLTFK